MATIPAGTRLFAIRQDNCPTERIAAVRRHRRGPERHTIDTHLGAVVARVACEASVQALVDRHLLAHPKRILRRIHEHNVALRAYTRTLFSEQDGATEEREIAVRKYIDEHGKQNGKITLSELERELGCSRQVALRTSAWDTYNTEWERRYGKCRTRDGKGRRPTIADGDIDALSEEQAYSDEIRRLRDEQALDDNYQVGPFDHI